VTQARRVCVHYKEPSSFAPPVCVHYKEPSSFPRRRESSVVLSLLFLPSLLFAQDFSALDAASGKALFDRSWVQAPASAAAADGLGPYFNARSCAACHPAGGAGTATLTTMNVVIDDPGFGQMLQLRAVPGIEPEAQAALMYEAAGTMALADGTSVRLSKPRLVVDDQLDLESSQRRAPSLAGLALLEQVPLETLQARADPDDRDGNGISGEIAEGRFGWKAQTVTLREQIARALSLDLGLGSSLLPSAAGDCTPQQHACIEAARGITGDKFEAPDVVLDLLAAYIRGLPTPAAPAAAGQGAELFMTLGCQSCHTAELKTGAGQTLRPFTDLLLHDLGPDLASGHDPGWRTAPLWGLRERGPFLHDGRAATLVEAILWHGGEAAQSREAYRNLNSAQRAVLQDWLLGL
jgi:CxxC motif-containing protein (DUF1111 family)